MSPAPCWDLFPSLWEDPVQAKAAGSDPHRISIASPIITGYRITAS